MMDTATGYVRVLTRFDHRLAGRKRTFPGTAGGIVNPHFPGLLVRRGNVSLKLRHILIERLERQVIQGKSGEDGSVKGGAERRGAQTRREGGKPHSFNYTGLTLVDPGVCWDE